MSKIYDEQLHDLLETMLVSSDPKRDNRDFKTNMKIRAMSQQTYVMVLAVHRDDDKNKIEKISCDRGAPLGGYVYDSINECFFISCIDLLPLGYVPVSFKLEMKGTGYWEVDIPMPENVLRRYFGDSQLHDLQRFKSIHPKGECKFQFLQFIADA